MMTDIAESIRHRDQLTKEHLSSLEIMVNKYPYFQVPRLLYLYLLHETKEDVFERELHKSSIFITDRRALFSLIKNKPHHEPDLPSEESVTLSQPMCKTNSHEEPEEKQPDDEAKNSRSFSLIDDFLSEYADKSHQETPVPSETSAGGGVTDYTSYLLQMNEHEEDKEQLSSEEEPQKEVHVISSRPIPKKKQEEMEAPASVIEPTEGVSDKYFTETLAKIYVKQGKYSKALEIIQRLYLRDPNKNIYFADQIRYLEKLLINSRNQTKKTK